MNWLELPPLNSLRAFCAVAETENVTLAARRLNVTHAAVSQQIKLLEQRLGTALVLRSGRGVALTRDGAALARDLEMGFAAIQRGVERIKKLGQDQPVQVTMSPAFATEWLMPRIVEFQQEHPGITLMLTPTAALMELKPGGIDVAIRYRHRRRQLPDARPVLVSDMIVIGAKSLVAGLDLSSPQSLATMPWLQELGTNEAADWLTAHGVVLHQPLRVNQMPGNLIMDAVRRGDGLSYTARAFFQDDLAHGRVVELFSEPLSGIYALECQPEPIRPSVQLFLDWIVSKAETITSEGNTKPR